MNNEQIKKIIADFLTHLGVAFSEIDVITSSVMDGTTYVIRTSESGLLIGKHGEHFSSLKHLLKRIIQKQLASEDILFNIDVNDYQTRLLNDLKNKIKIMGDRALSFKVNVELDPMTSYERMIVHSYFSENPELSTESIGQGKSRRVVIRYTPDKPKRELSSEL